MSATFKLPPTERDFEIYEAVHIAHRSTYSQAEKHQISQTRVRQIVRRVVEWLGEVLPPQADVAKEDEVAAMFAHMIDTFGRIDICVPNSGIQLNARIDEMTLGLNLLRQEKWREAGHPTDALELVGELARRLEPPPENLVDPLRQLVTSLGSMALGRRGWARGA